MANTQIVQVGNVEYVFPLDMSDEEIKKALDKEVQQPSKPAQPAPQPEAPPPAPPQDQYIPFANVPESIKAEELIGNKDWMDASSMLYQTMERKPFEGTPQELSDWSRQFMSDFNYNIVDTGIIAHRLHQSDQFTKEAFLYMMDTFDNTEMSWQGAANATWSVVTDPTTYTGIASLGVGTAFRYGAKKLGKEALKLQLKKSLGRTGLISGTEGGIYAYADDDIRQNLEINAGRKTEKDTTQALVNTGLGIVAGTTLGVGLDVLSTKVGQFIGARRAEKAASDAVDTPEVKQEATTTTESPKATTPEAPKVEEPKATTPEATPEAPQDNLTAVREVAGIRVPEHPEKLSATTHMDVLTNFAEDVAYQLRKVTPGEGRRVFEQLQLERMTLAEFSHFKRSAQMAKGAIMDQLAEVSAKIADKPNPTLYAKRAMLNEQHEALVKLDHSFAYYGGLDQRARQEGITMKEDFTYSSLLQEDGVDESNVAQVFAQRTAALRETRAFKAKEAEYDRSIRDSLDKNDVAGALRQISEKNRELDNLSKLGHGEATRGQKLAEISIGNVFSMTTIQVNAVSSAAKGFVLPALRGLMKDPLELATRKEVAASYSAMRTSIGAAWRASKLAWRYEQALLTRDPERFLESGLSVKGTKGGALRFFIRATNATDEFLSHLNYNGFIAGRAAAEATEKAQELGLKGVKLDEYVQKQVTDSLEAAYKQSDIDKLVTPIVNKGKNLGLTGTALQDYIEKEVARDPDALRAGANEDALQYVRDVLYKKSFSGEGDAYSKLASSGAKTYENWINNHPTFKWITGQLFFRTPVRVFEEGIRISPVAQYMAPNFIADLRGKNGIERQMRARAESLMAFTITSSVATLWAEGRITGSGDYKDWRQEALQRDSHLPDPYTIQLEDGSTWSYRFFDPLATPMKAIVSTLEAMDKLAIRRAQGEDVGDNQFERLGNVAIVASLALAKAIKDANLATGASNLFDAAAAGVDPEDRTGFWLRFVGDKLRTLVPNTLRKFDKDEHGDMKAPADLLQMVQAQMLDPFRVLGLEAPIVTSNAYDHLGRVKTLTDSGSLYNIFSTTSVEERQKGRSEDEMFVDQELVRLQRETGLVLRVPFMHHSTGDMDFRTELTTKGDETLYDKWNRLYNEQIPMEALADLMSRPLPDGTFKHRAARVQLVVKLLNEARDRAFKLMLADEQQVVDKFREELLRKAYAESGRFDAGRTTTTPKFPWEQ